MNKFSMGQRIALVLSVGGAIAFGCEHPKDQDSGTTEKTPGEEAGAGGGGGGQGGSAKSTGSPCADDTECADTRCLSEGAQGWPAGYCSGPCDGSCPGGGICAGGACLTPCADATSCRAGYACRALGGGEKACLPACSDNSHCVDTGSCDAATGYCEPKPEAICDDLKDDDGDTRVDCVDTDCKEACAPRIDAACAAAIAGDATIHGDTNAGSFLFGASCVGGAGKEQIISYTVPGAAGQRGALTIRLNAQTDMGFYVRSACGDADAEIACQDGVAEGLEEVQTIQAEGGQQLTIFVDSGKSDQAGPFDLDLTFKESKCGDGVMVPPEECDDGNEASGDGCDANCKVESGQVCGSAAPAQEVNQDTTEGGTAAFQGTCTGDLGAFERIYTITPPSNGMLDLVLSSATDQGLYVRTDCGDINSEIGCADFNQAGVDEQLSVYVNGGEQLYIFVDGYASPEEAGPFTLKVKFNPN